MKITFDKKDVGALEKCLYVVRNDRIYFAHGAEFSIERLGDILKQVKKMKLDKNSMMCGMILKFPYKIPKALKRIAKSEKKKKKIVKKKPKRKKK